MKRKRISGGEDRATEILEAGALEAANAVRETYEWLAKICESPIERILLAQYLHPRTGGDFDMRTDVLCPPSRLLEHCQPPPIEGVYLWPQIKIGPYRVDFLAGVYRYDGLFRMAAIECDGHDFHEKTKAQAQRDKARDRYFTGRGVQFLRFTGSEIYRDPAKVWDEIIKVLLDVCDP